MMKVITGKLFKTSFGIRIIYDKQDERLSRGDIILYNGGKYIIENVIPPTVPGGKWALHVNAIA